MITRDMIRRMLLEYDAKHATKDEARSILARLPDNYIVDETILELAKIAL